MKTVLIVVDMQNDFMDKPGAALPVPGATAIIPLINKTIIELQKQVLVLFTQDWHDPNSPHFSETPDYQKTWPVHCVAGSQGAALVEELYLPIEASYVHKGMGTVDGYSAFEGKVDHFGELIDLLPFLQARGIENVYVCGVATDYCVKATAVDAAKNGFNTFLISNAVAGVNPETSDTAIKTMAQSDVTMLQFHI